MRYGNIIAGTAVVKCGFTASVAVQQRRHWDELVNPGDERSYGEYSKMAAVLCRLVADSLPGKTVRLHFIA